MVMAFSFFSLTFLILPFPPSYDSDTRLHRPDPGPVWRERRTNQSPQEREASKTVEQGAQRIESQKRVVSIPATF
jgi:hypothetical protein